MTEEDKMGGKKHHTGKGRTEMCYKRTTREFSEEQEMERTKKRHSKQDAAE